MKRYHITAAAVCLAILIAFGACNGVWRPSPVDGVLKVGFIYENDGSTPFTYNFMLAQQAVEQQYGEKVEVLSRSNVHGNETEEPLLELVRKGCGIVFINTDSTDVRAVAEKYPDVQFCQISVGDDASSGSPANYHTFGGEIYQGRYVSGVAAGLKLRQMIDAGVIAPHEALVGFVGAYPVAEVISAYTAFLLGVRSVAPEAVMRVRYIDTWSSFTQEKNAAQALIEEGCVVIGQHTNTIGPALACEEAAQIRPVIHVGYNQSMLGVAPTSSLISTRINWTPYIVSAVGAVFSGKPIEKYVEGNVHGNDISAGFERGWVAMLDLNKHLAAEGTEEKLARVIEDLQKGAVQVFKGDYIGVDPENSADTYDLSQGYTENKGTSCPTFHYVLAGIIQIDE